MNNVFLDIQFSFQCISCAHLGIGGGGHVQSAVAYHIGGRGKGNGGADKKGGDSKLHISSRYDKIDTDRMLCKRRN